MLIKLYSYNNYIYSKKNCLDLSIIETLVYYFKFITININIVPWTL